MFFAFRRRIMTSSAFFIRTAVGGFRYRKRPQLSRREHVASMFWFVKSSNRNLKNLKTVAGKTMRNLTNSPRNRTFRIRVSRFTSSRLCVWPRNCFSTRSATPDPISGNTLDSVATIRQ